jgi:hypothetical protein
MYKSLWKSDSQIVCRVQNWKSRDTASLWYNSSPHSRPSPHDIYLNFPILYKYIRCMYWFWKPPCNGIVPKVPNRCTLSPVSSRSFFKGTGSPRQNSIFFYKNEYLYRANIEPLVVFAFMFSDKLPAVKVKTYWRNYINWSFLPNLC